MGDIFLHNQFTRTAIKALKVPVPLPQPLERGNDTFIEKPLAEKQIKVFADKTASDLITVLEESGLEQADNTSETDGIVFDARDIDTVDGLGSIYDFFQTEIPRLRRCSSIVLCTRRTTASPTDAACQGALQGFLRSLAKETGRKGTRVNLVQADKLQNIAGPLRFLLSGQSAFITGQALTIAKATKKNGQWERPLAEKTALVTGAARGIGAAIAHRLAAEGARVLLLDRPDQLGVLKNLATATAGTAIAVDVTDDNSAKSILRALRGGDLDILVHNAGVTRDKTLARMKKENWDLVLDVNLKAVLRLTDELKSSLSSKARIVCLSSVAGVAGNAGQTNYASAKAGLIYWAEAMARAMPKTAVNAVAPGFIETKMTEVMPAAIKQVARRLSSLSQGGLPQDVANAVAFLASHYANGITGQTLRVCGGSFLGR